MSPAFLTDNFSRIISCPEFRTPFKSSLLRRSEVGQTNSSRIKRNTNKWKNSTTKANQNVYPVAPHLCLRSQTSHPPEALRAVHHPLEDNSQALHRARSHHSLHPRPEDVRSLPFAHSEVNPAPRGLYPRPSPARDGSNTRDVALARPQPRRNRAPPAYRGGIPTHARISSSRPSATR